MEPSTLQARREAEPDSTSRSRFSRIPRSHQIRKHCRGSRAEPFLQRGSLQAACSSSASELSSRRRCKAVRSSARTLLGRNVELGGGLLCRSLFARDAVTKRNHLTLLRGQRVEQLVETCAGEPPVDALVRLARLRVDDLSGRFAAVGVRTVQRDEACGNVQRLLGLGERERCCGGEFVERGLAFELACERLPDPCQPAPSFVDVNGDPDRLCLIADGTVDGLADPPDCIGGELVAAAPVELLARADQAERSFLDEVEERDLWTLVVLGDRDDQAEVRIDQPLLRLLVAAFDPLRQLHFLRPREQAVATDRLQVERERVGGSCAGLARAL